MSTSKITVQATIAQNAKKTWDYYTNPLHIVKWNFASDDWQCPRAENDLRVGGKYSARMEAKDGSFGFDFETVYSEVVDQQKFAYTMGDGRHAATEFENQGDKTKITIVFDPESQNPVEMQQNGWQAILNNFKRYAESN